MLRTFTVIALAVAVAGCEDPPAASLTEAEPETFDAATVYEIVPVGGTPSQPGDPSAVFVRFDNEEAKRVLAEALAESALYRLEPLPAERAAQVWKNERVVYAMGATADGHWRIVHTYNHDYAAAHRAAYGPRKQEEVVR